MGAAVWWGSGVSLAGFWGFKHPLTKACQNSAMKALVLPLFLAACGAQPTPQMFGAERFDATRNGRAYTLYLKGNMAEVIRLGYARRGEHQGIRATMIALVPELTGCTIIASTWQGDSGEMRGRVRCPKPSG